MKEVENIKYKVCQYFDDVYQGTIADKLSIELAKEIQEEATKEYGYDHITYKIEEYYPPVISKLEN